MALNQELMHLGKDKSILLVEDEKDTIDALYLILEKYFYTIDTALDGQEGLEKFQTKQYDIVITDIHMERMNGLEMIEAIKKLGLDAKFIVVTAFNSSDYLLQAINLEVRDYLVKPLSFKTINQKLVEVCKIIDNERAAIEKIELAAKLEELNQKLQEKVIEETNKRLVQEQILMQQSKMAEMGELMGVIAHQWKQPLSVISLVFEMLKDELSSEIKDTEILKEYINNGSKQISFLINTIDDFRNFLKPSQEKTYFTLSDLLLETENIISALLLRSNITANITKDTEKRLVYGYKNELKHVFLNLFSNSADALSSYRERNNLQKSEYEGVIDIHVMQKDDFEIIEFCDNAGGIDETILPKLFQKYATSKGEKGTGIGLYMAKSMIQENMGGEMFAKNIPGGACLTIKIPLSDKERDQDVTDTN